MKVGRNMTYQEIKNMLLMVDDEAVRLEMLIDFGKYLQAPPPDAECVEILGCSSFVQICNKNGIFYGVADSLVRGIVFVMLAMVDGKNAAQIKEMDMAAEFKSLKLNLGAGRLNGVNSMIRFFKNL